jgi:hypothetical protein
MTKAQAWKEAQKRWGKRAIIRHSPRALTEAAKAPLRERRKAVKAELEVTPRTPETMTKRSALIREERDLMGRVLGDRCSVGQEMDILAAFHVMGSGDTWEQAFAKADERYPQPVSGGRSQ